MKDEIQNLVHAYDINDGEGYTAAELLQVIITLLSPPYFFTDKKGKGDQLLFNELSTSTKPINEIRIYQGGVEYKFKDRAILAMFQDWITDSARGLSKEEQDQQTEELYQHLIETVRPLFNKLQHLRPRKRHLLIYELLQLAGYPFTRQQLSASEQTKASLIGKWLERSSPKISSSTIKYAQENFPDLDLSEQYPQFFKSDDSPSKRNKKRKKTR